MDGVPADGGLVGLTEEGTSSGPVSGAQRILDHFGVRGRLDEVLRYLWRGGSLSLLTESAAALPHVRYVARADWEAVVFVPASSLPTRAIARELDPLVEGTWQRGRAEYWLAVGIDTATAPSAIYVRAEGLSYLVPFLDRSDQEVSRALDRALTDYARAFTERLRPVSEAMAVDAERLCQFGL